MNTSVAEKIELTDILDDALSRLRTTDRDAIALRYLQAHTLAEVGQTLGITEEAARKRITRALNRLRQSLADRGFPLTASAMPITLSTFAAPPAPPATVAAAIATSKAPASASILSLSKGTLRMLAIKEIALVSAIVLLGLSAIAGVTVLAQSPPPATPLPAATLAAPPEPPSTSPPLTINTIALQLAVTDIEANIDFFKKVGFRIRWMDKPGANGRLVRATVDSGSIRIRMYRVPAAPHLTKNLIPYFWIDGGSPAIAALHNQLTSRGIKVGRLDNSMQLLSFDLITPDGYTMGFYTQP